jgi:hypothetical protein
MGAAPGPGLFFVTRQSSTGCSFCAIGMSLANPPCNSSSCAAGCAQTDATSNDIFGCGTAGQAPLQACGVLDRFGNDLCSALPPAWRCGNDGFAEAKNVTLTDPAIGGALCCRD